MWFYNCTSKYCGQYWLADLLIGDAKTTAEKVIQIRNVAAIIQNNRPDVLLMAEYNNDGVGENKTALDGFQQVFSVP